MIPTPKELLSELKTDEIVNPLVEKICKAIATELSKVYNCSDLQALSTFAIKVKVIHTTSLEKLRDRKNILADRTLNKCSKSNWVVSDENVTINSSEKSTDAEIEFEANFKPKNLN